MAAKAVVQNRNERVQYCMWERIVNNQYCNLPNFVKYCRSYRKNFDSHNYNSGKQCNILLYIELLLHYYMANIVK